MSIRYRTIGVLVAIVVAGSSVLRANAAPAQLRALSNRNVTPGLANAVRIRRADPNRTLDVTVSLALRNQTALDAFIAAVSDPTSRSYGRYLRPTQFAALYSPTQAQAQQVVDYLQTEGLTGTSVTTNRTLVHATGSARAVESAFGVNIWDWHDGAENRDFFGNDTQPVLPASLAAFVVGIAGLNNHYQAHRHAYTPHPALHLMGGGEALVGTGPVPTKEAVKRFASSFAGSGPGGGYTPNDLKSAYDIAPLAAMGYAGAGQPLGLFELDAFNPVNIATYDHNYGLTTQPVAVVPVDGGVVTPGPGELEVELDIELMHAIAPSAPITVWEAPNTDRGAIDAYNAMVVSDSTPANSTSWGFCEPDTSPAMMSTLDAIFKQAAVEGQSFFAASGDSGAYDCLSRPSLLAVDYPASDPYVTAVGGTTLTITNGAYVSESAWFSSTTSPRVGSGGGLSQVFAQPGWQTGPGVANAYSSQMRQVPDVALNADPKPGYSVYITDRGVTGWAVLGGTSAGAPGWAAFTAILNQYRFTAGGDRPAMGFANPALYRLGQGTSPYPAYHDVTTGNNLYYPATLGWDFATGWGSFDAFNLARDVTLVTVPQTPPQAGALTERTTPPPPLPPRPRNR